ncbi:hypothetical protein FRC09_010138 [Ceratobasidium sp. 395]|nr:hypothetical protein FRC09_010138 [Ceratobasidium sp. 395]
MVSSPTRHPLPGPTSPSPGACATLLAGRDTLRSVPPTPTFECLALLRVPGMSANSSPTPSLTSPPQAPLSAPAPAPVRPPNCGRANHERSRQVGTANKITSVR